MFKKIALGVIAFLVLLVGGFCVVVVMQPDTVEIERATTIKATPDRVFLLLNDFREWNRWSPWMDLDPDAKGSISNPSHGKGAKLTWDGNAEVGKGTMTIVDAQPGKLVALEQVFERPMQGTADIRFIIEENSQDTKLRWTMKAPQNFFCKAMCMFMNMDAMLGAQMEKGLASIKELAEKDETPEKKDDESP